MKITVRSGTGTGPTPLAAFDEALRTAGVANFNLIRLSSIIPPGTEVVASGTEEKLSGGWGDRLFAVFSDIRTDQPNEEVWAGVGWVQGANGQGMFVEHEGNSEKQVRADIRATLSSMIRSRPGDYGQVAMEVVGITCEDKPVCAVVIAPYRVEGWAGKWSDRLGRR